MLAGEAISCYSNIQSCAPEPILARAGARIYGNSCPMLQKRLDTAVSPIAIKLTSGNIICNPEHIRYDNCKNQIVEVELWCFPFRGFYSTGIVWSRGCPTPRAIFLRIRPRRVVPSICKCFMRSGCGTGEACINRIKSVDAPYVGPNSHYGGICSVVTWRKGNITDAGCCSVPVDREK